MLRKIYRELVAIRKELQAIQKGMEPRKAISSIKNPTQLSPDSVERRLRPKQNSNMQKQHSEIGKKEENLDYKQTHLNRYYAWKIIRTIATPPPDELQRLSPKEYAKISRKEIKKIFKYTISLLKGMSIDSLDEVKF